MNTPAYQFTNDWFGVYARQIWTDLLPQFRPVRVLEIGAFEGASTCFLIAEAPAHTITELHCIDTWEGGIEHQEGGENMAAVEQRFVHNVNTALAQAGRAVQVQIRKGYSDRGLSRLPADKGPGAFDFIYVDGSHQAPDVLCDAVLAFRLLRVGGVLAFDDYLWHETTPPDPLRCPKVAIDAFVNIYVQKLQVLRTPMYQLYVQKLSD